MTVAFAATTKYLLTMAAIPMERRRARRHLTRRSLRLHLGSSTNRIPGWVNVDLLRPGRRLDLYWDLRRPLPYPDGSVDAVFSEHLFEHLEFDDGIRLMTECRRVLRSGGIMRVGVPDLGRYVASYLEQDNLIDTVRPGRPTRAIALGEVFFLHGHRCMYDFQTMRVAMERAGFVGLVSSKSGAGEIHPNPDSPSRADETLYVEAISPGRRSG